MVAAPETPDQKRIWAYFQNRAPESFAGAEPRLDYLLARIAEKAGGRPRVLNVGMGSGYFERRAQDLGWEIHALDPDAEAIERLAARGVRARCGVIERSGLPGDWFDFVVISEVLEHLDDAQRGAGLREVARILRPGGWLLGTAPYREQLAANQVVCPRCGEQFHRWGHQKSFDRAELARELSAGLRVARMRPTAFVAFGGRSVWAKLRGLARILAARCGAGIAQPSWYFEASKPAGGAR